MGEKAKISKQYLPLHNISCKDTAYKFYNVLIVAIDCHHCAERMMNIAVFNFNTENDNFSQ
jgi:hypothetical protein